MPQATPSCSESGQDDIDITCCVACFNEEDNIIGTLTTLVDALGEVGRTWEIVVIDDASTDRSVELVRGFMAERPGCPIRLKVNARNQGLGQVFVEGAFIGRGRYYRLVCGDNVESRERLVAVLGRTGEAEMIIPHSVRWQGRSFARRAISAVFTSLVNGISGYDISYYNGLTVHERAQVMRWHSNAQGFGFQADLITRLLDQGCSFIEVPVEGGERRKGKTKALTLMNFLSVSHTLMDIAIRRLGSIARGRRI